MNIWMIAAIVAIWWFVGMVAASVAMPAAAKKQGVAASGQRRAA
jgi:hypothetical protein